MAAYPPRKILVPVDFSKSSAAALEIALNVAKVHGSETSVLHVMEDPALTAAFAAGGMAVPAPAAIQWDQIKEEIRLGCERSMEKFLSNVDIAEKLRSELAWGSPASVIVEKAKSENFDLIVMSTHGREGVKRLIMGSVAERVVRTAGVLVLVIPPEEGDSG